VAFEVAQRLHAPLDVLVARKLGAPGHEEFALGAIAGGVRILNQNTLRGLGITSSTLADITARESTELRRREFLYRSHRPPLSVTGKIAIIVDDGIATGATLRAAAHAIRSQHPARMIIAAPVAPHGFEADFAGEADELIVLMEPEDFHAVGEWYADFSEVSDAEVVRLLDSARAGAPTG
jgi:predicted phosphoribosyltransferase